MIRQATKINSNLDRCIYEAVDVVQAIHYSSTMILLITVQYTHPHNIHHHPPLDTHQN